jgi:hypothetical protein
MTVKRETADGKITYHTSNITHPEIGSSPFNAGLAGKH